MLLFITQACSTGWVQCSRNLERLVLFEVKGSSKGSVEVMKGVLPAGVILCQGVAGPKSRGSLRNAWDLMVGM